MEGRRPLGPRIGSRLRELLRRYWVPLFLALALALVALGASIVVIGHEGGLLLVELVIAAIIGIATFILGALLGHRIKMVAERIGMTTCPDCHGDGHVACSRCGGQATVPVETDVLGACTACNGTGRTTISCPACGGRRSVTRQARFEQVGPDTRVRYEYNPLKHLGHWQDVIAGIHNLENQPVSYQLGVQVYGAGTSGGPLQVGPGVTQTATYSFKIHGAVAYAVTVSITPGTVTVQCETCRGTGSVPANCQACNGSGKVGSKQTTEIPCPDCHGQGKAQCAKCKGSGRVPRI